MIFNKVLVKTIDHLQMVKTQDNNEFHFAHIGLAKLKIFSNKLTPFNMDSGRQITEMKFFDEKDRTYRPVDINSFVSLGIMTHKYKFKWADGNA